ncbi:MAG: hypothetical protein ABIU06_16815 [Anaerolineales bacterium]
MEGKKAFLTQIFNLNIKAPERYVVYLWYCSQEDPLLQITPNQIGTEFEQMGFGKQNISRIKEYLFKDKRTVKGQNNGFIIRPTARDSLEQNYGQFLHTRPVPKYSGVIQPELFKNSRGYIIKVVEQINASYQYNLFDCCAVMCRRLLETLIIECYEKHSRSDEIKDKDNNFFMFSGLLSAVESDKSLSLGRSSMQALRDFKKLGDLSAHNRRFNARRSDIDQVRDSLRITSEELLHIAGQAI